MKVYEQKFPVTKYLDIPPHIAVDNSGPICVLDYVCSFKCAAFSAFLFCVVVGYLTVE